MINPAKAASNHKITGIDITNDTLADRGGLAPLIRYVRNSGLLALLLPRLAKLRANRKGISVAQLVIQVFAFFFDGTSRHLTYFDHLKTDAGYAAVLETDPDDLASSHQVKRFFAKFPRVFAGAFRCVLRRMFTHRLAIVRPATVSLFLDTMVLDNDGAAQRQGSQPTYKKVKGFQPLQLIWNGQIIDAQFRGGSKNGNHDRTAWVMIEKAVKLIEKTLGPDVPVLVRIDGGFFDGSLFRRMDEYGIGFVCSGRLTPFVKAFAADQTRRTMWESYTNGKQAWSYFEFGFRCKSWKRFYRAFYLKPRYEGEQMLLEFARPEGVILTNLGSDPHLFTHAEPALREQLFSAENLIGEHHSKGGDELTHRALKDFGFEQMPFKDYGANAAFYYFMVIAFNVMNWYKEDVLVEMDLVGKGSYATTVRRVAIDFAAKIVRSGRRVVLKVTSATMSRVRLDELWQRCNAVDPMMA